MGAGLIFLLQEMNREVNTIGSKGNDVHIASCVVELKSELEKKCGNKCRTLNNETENSMLKG